MAELLLMGSVKDKRLNYVDQLLACYYFCVIKCCHKNWWRLVFRKISQCSFYAVNATKGSLSVARTIVGSVPPLKCDDGVTGLTFPTEVQRFQVCFLLYVCKCLCCNFFFCQVTPAHGMEAAKTALVYRHTHSVNWVLRTSLKCF